MKSAVSFFIAARECEVSELEHLAVASGLVSLLGRLIHALQRERGTSNVFLVSRGGHFAGQREAQAAECVRLECELRAHLDTLYTDAACASNGARLFSRIAVALHALDTLPALRERVAAQALSAEAATAAFIRLIAGLLAVVFEAADSATDPEISRALVAMFNFMQGKEFSGQERAIGAAAFASGRADPARMQQWPHLIELQERCFQVFADFSDAAVREAWHRSRDADADATLERLRRTALMPRPGDPLDSGLSLLWYDCCTRRIDVMRTLEDLLAARLRQLCERKIAQAHGGLRDQQAALDGLLQQQVDRRESDGPTAYGPQLERSILEMMQAQSRRLQTMSDELDSVRAALNERKVVERAKGLLMAHRHLSEEEAHKTLRQMAMNQGRKLTDIAEAVLAMAELIPNQPR